MGTSVQKMSTCHLEITNMRFKIEANQIKSMCQLLTEIVLSWKKCKEKGTHNQEDDLPNMFNPCDQLDDILVNLDDFLPIWNPKNTNAKRCFQELVSTVFSSIEDDKVYHISQASFY